MTLEELEFSICQHLDGTLPAGHQALLESQLAMNPQARTLLQEYRELNQALRAERVPEMNWNALANHLSAAVQASSSEVTSVVTETKRLTTEEFEQLEFTISQYVDGELTDEERAAFEARLKTDSDARLLLNEHRRIRDVICSMQPMPEIRWDALSAHLSNAVADAHADTQAARVSDPSDKPIFSFKWTVQIKRMSIAACILIAAGVAIVRIAPHLGKPIGSPQGGETAVVIKPDSHPAKPGGSIVVIAPPATVAPHSFSMVSGPQADQAAGPAVSDVEIGGPALAADVAPLASGTTPQFADVVVSRPSRVVIATGENLDQDASSMPY